MPQAHADIQLLPHTRLSSERALVLPLARPAVARGVAQRALSEAPAWFTSCSGLKRRCSSPRTKPDLAK
jgi:hypothetical protein